MLVSATLGGCGGPSAEELAAVDYTPLVLDDWAVSTPEEQELDPALVAGLCYIAEQLETLYGLLVINNDYMVAEKYFHGQSIDQLSTRAGAGLPGAPTYQSRRKWMKAIVHTAYGPPDELELREVEKPVPKDNEVLIRIHATTVTSSDCNVRNLTFAPTWSVLPMRMQFGLREPKITRLGIDLAGEVEAAGKDVKRYKQGDKVFGRPDPALGAHAEYICLPEDGVLATKPADMTWEEAACLPLAGNTALYFVRDLGKIQAGQKVLIANTMHKISHLVFLVISTIKIGFIG